MRIAIVFWTLLHSSHGFSISSTLYQKRPVVANQPTHGIVQRTTNCITLRAQRDDDDDKSSTQQQGLDFNKMASQLEAFKSLTLPYFAEAKSGRWLFLGLIALTLMNSGVSVAFSYVGKDFWNALSSKDPDQFNEMIWKYAAALLIGSPVSVLYR